MNIRVVPVLVAGFLMSIASPALAQENGSSWFAGVGAGRLNADFRPYYTYYGGGTPDQFENEAHGLEVEVLAGRRRQLTRRFSISVQGSAAFHSFNWSLSIPEEPAELKYSLPYRFAASVVPEVHFGRVSVYADIGGGFGRVRQLKTSPSSSAYDFDELRTTLNVGGGIKVRASSTTSVYAHIGHVRYSGYGFDSFLQSGCLIPEGCKIEHVTDGPRATGFTAGVVKRF